MRLVGCILTERGCRSTERECLRSACSARIRGTVTPLAIVNGVAVVVLVVVTAYYAWQSRQMVAEMRFARRLSLLPRLVLDVSMVGPTYGDVAVRNIGSGPALDADLTLVFEPGASGNRDERRWLAHVVAPGEGHEFLPRQEISSMDDLAREHPAIALTGTMKDLFGEAHEISERINIADAWARVPDALHRWERTDAAKIVRELERIDRRLQRLDRRFSTLTNIAQRWWHRTTGEEDVQGPWSYLAEARASRVRPKSAASSLSPASSYDCGIRCPYVSSVIWTLACPSCSEISFGCSPARSGGSRTYGAGRGSGSAGDRPAGAPGRARA